MTRIPLTQVGQIESFHWKLVNDDIPSRVHFPFAASELSLGAAIELLCIERHLPESANFNLSLKLNNSHLWKLIKRLDWPRCEPGFSVRVGSTGFMVLPLDSSDWRWTAFLLIMQKALKQHCFPEHLAGALTGAVGEMVDNVWEHSETSVPGLVAFEVRHRRLNFAVADLGIGVLQSLRKNPHYRFLNSSMEALQKAILKGVSRLQGQSRGYGFSRLLKAVAELWGFTRLRSGQAVLVFDRLTEARKRVHKYLPPLPGVQIAVCCGLDAPASF
jgi:anti-sigma regulatory factor (Ser/Thr protein kinase)